MYNCCSGISFSTCVEFLRDKDTVLPDAKAFCRNDDISGWLSGCCFGWWSVVKLNKSGLLPDAVMPPFTQWLSWYSFPVLDAFEVTSGKAELLPKCLLCVGVCVAQWCVNDGFRFRGGGGGGILSALKGSFWKINLNYIPLLNWNFVKPKPTWIIHWYYPGRHLDNMVGCWSSSWRVGLLYCV